MEFESWRYTFEIRLTIRDSQLPPDDRGAIASPDRYAFQKLLGFKAYRCGHLIRYHTAHSMVRPVDVCQLLRSWLLPMGGQFSTTGGSRAAPRWIKLLGNENDRVLLKDLSQVPLALARAGWDPVKPAIFSYCSCPLYTNRCYIFS
jgi:hypothetical protein